MKFIIFVIFLVFSLSTALSNNAFGANYSVLIPAGSGSSQNCVQQNNCFEPENVSIYQGDSVVWTNDDSVSHYVTSGNPSDSQTGTLFDSGGLIKPGYFFSHSFNNVGTFNYFCSIHPWLVGTVTVQGETNQVSSPSQLPSTTTADIKITQGSGSSQACSPAINCFNPNFFETMQGNTITWGNDDSLSHTVTSGRPSDSNAGSIFDSGLISSGGTFSHTFNDAGSYYYFCTIHPWMTGSLVILANTPTMPTSQPSFSPSPILNEIIIEGTGIPVSYSITYGKVLGMKIDPPSKSLIVSVNSVGNGMLTVTLPRGLMDATLQNGQDDQYYVMVDGREINFQETSTTTNDRTLSIPFTAGASEIEIIGTKIIPEFGSIVGMVIVISLIGVIVVNKMKLRENC